MAIFLKIAEKSGSRAGVLHQPLAPGPRGSRGRGKRAISGLLGRGWKRGLREAPGAPRDPGTPGPPPGNRGAPARGVDVKPRTRRCPGPRPGPRDPVQGLPGGPLPPGAGPGSETRIPGSGSGTPSRAPRDPGVREPGPEGPPRPLGGAAGGCFTSTPRGGAPRFPGAPRVPHDATERWVPPGRRGPRAWGNSS